MTHLTERERQELADGTLPGPRAAQARRHIACCASCAIDVNRLQSVVAALRDVGDMPQPGADAWPAIRARLGARGVRRLPTKRGWMVGLSMAAAAVLAIAVVTSRTRTHPDASASRPSSAAPSVLRATTVLDAADSTRAYEAQVRQLLDEIDLQRALLRPGSAADSDLHVIDQAIAELQAALARDPGNPALRQLLAATYRQKRDLLERVRNAS